MKRERDNKGRFISSNRTCEIEGCNRKYRCKGLCGYHYEKIYISKFRKQWHQTNKEKVTKRKKQYRKDNKEHCLRLERQSCIRNKVSIKAYQHNRRALLKGLTKDIIQRVYKDNIKKYGVLTCYLCFKPIVNNNDSLDHSIPLSRGGSNNYDNFGIAHQSCNNKKYTKTLEEWRAMPSNLERG